jgi:hypothetical protein
MLKTCWNRAGKLAFILAELSTSLSGRKKKASDRC